MQTQQLSRTVDGAPQHTDLWKLRFSYRAAQLLGPQQAEALCYEQLEPLTDSRRFAQFVPTPPALCRSSTSSLSPPFLIIWIIATEMNRKYFKGHVESKYFSSCHRAFRTAARFRCKQVVIDVVTSTISIFCF